LLARWRNCEMLLTGDTEAEAVPLEPGPLDVLKIAHHGSADAGLDALLDRTAPGLAVISVGDGNPFGHPDPLVLRSLRKHGVRILRTDRSGTIELAVVDDRLRLWTRD
jgi:competence protein ComEC